MTTITTRAGKGSPLTNSEVDANFTNLNDDKQEILTEGAFVDGDKNKLDGIEDNADVTDTANVTSAGALMDSELTSEASVKALDQGVATTDSPSFAGLTATTADINSGTIDGTTIGGSTPAAGSFTGLTVGDGHTIGDDGSDNLEISSSSGENIIFDSSAGNILFKNNGSDTARFDSDDRLLIGQNSSFDLNAGLQIATKSGQYDGLPIEVSRFDSSDNSDGPLICFLRSNSETIGGNTAVTDDDGLGGMLFRGADGTGYVNSAYIEVSVDGTPGTNDMPGRLQFYTTADGASSFTERMRIDNKGTVRVFKSSLLVDTASLSVSDLDDFGLWVGTTGNNVGNTIFNGIRFGDGYAGMYGYDGGAQAATGLGFFSGNNVGVAEAMRIDSSQRVIVGHTSPIALSGTETYFQVVGTTFNNSSYAATIFRNDANGPLFMFGKSRSATKGTAGTIVQDNDVLGNINWSADDGTDINSNPARISGQIDGTPGVNDTPGRLIFYTASDGAAAVTERMRLDSEGNLVVGTGSYPHADKGIAFGEGSNRFGACIFKNTSGVANGGTFSLTPRTDGGGWGGILTVMAHKDGGADIYTQKVFAVMGRAASCTFTEIGTSSSGASPPTFTMSCPTNGAMTATISIASGNANISMVFNGGWSF